MDIKNYIISKLRARGKIAFISTLHPHAKILDVGCGNGSPFKTKRILPECHYTGIDIGNYNQTGPNPADSYLVTTSGSFANEIAKLAGLFNAVISSHNLEHCEDREGTFKAMLAALKPGGTLYMSLPCEESVNFPKRFGTLNYFDDETHKYSPPEFEKLIADLKRYNFEIIFSIRRYRPFLLRLIGLLCEPLSACRKKILPGTWEYYGFESIIWAKKL